MGHGDWKDMFAGVESNNIEIVRYYIHMGIDLNYQHPEFLTSPLIESIRRQHLQMMSFLLEQGASPDVKEAESGKTPLEIAQLTGNKQAVELLHQYLAKGY